MTGSVHLGVNVIFNINKGRCLTSASCVAYIYIGCIGGILWQINIINGYNINCMLH